MKNRINKIKNSWPVRNYQLVIILSLVVAHIVPLIQEQIPKSYASYTAPQTQSDDTVALIKKYADEIYADMYPEAEIRATTRVFKEAGIHAESLNPNK